MKKRSHIHVIVATVSACSILAVAACSGEKKEGASESTKQATQFQTSAAQATGDTIVVEMWTDGTGSYFKPNDVEADPGDVLRFVLKQGVHNVHFLADSNTIKTGLPPASEMLQLPEQTYDLVVSMQPGDYYFQCDPHAALGMKGKLEVEDKD